LRFKFDLWKNNELIGVLLRAERGLTKQLPFSKLITLDCHTASAIRDEQIREQLHHGTRTK
jgi:hypothetical protein